MALWAQVFTVQGQDNTPEDLPLFHLCNSPNLLLKTTINPSDNSLSFKVYDADNTSNKKDFTLHSLNLETFRNGLKNAAEKIKKTDTSTIKSLDCLNDDVISSYFYSIQFAIEIARSDTTKPKAGTLFLNRKGEVTHLPPHYTYANFYRKAYKWYYNNYITPYINNMAATIESNSEEEINSINFKVKAQDSLYTLYLGRFEYNKRYSPTLIRKVVDADKPKKIKKAFRQFKKENKIAQPLKSLIWDFITLDTHKEYKELIDVLNRDFQSKCGVLANYFKEKIGSYSDEYTYREGNLEKSIIDSASLDDSINKVKNRISEQKRILQRLGEKLGYDLRYPIPSLNRIINREELLRLTNEKLNDYKESYSYNKDSLEYSLDSDIMKTLSNQINDLNHKKEDINEIFRLDSSYRLSTIELNNLENRLKALGNSIDVDKALLESLKSKKNYLFQELGKKENQLNVDHINLIKDQQNRKITSVMEFNKVKIEFNDGFIENLVVEGKLNGKEDMIKGCIVDTIDFTASTNILDSALIPKKVHFENITPIGFSRKSDYEQLKNEPLYTRGGEAPFYSITLGEIIDQYKYNLALNRRDYSPRNQILAMKINSQDESTKETLYKAPTYSLFEAKIFSDFIGLDAGAPNGLIQTEVSKKIILNTERFPIHSGELTKLFSDIFKPYVNYILRLNFSIINFVEPSLSISKIEEDDRFLPIQGINRMEGGILTRDRYIGTLDLLNYERLNFGMRMNGFVLDMPSLKSTFFLNVGMNYGRTPIRDKVLDENGLVQEGQVMDSVLNTFRTYWELETQLKPDERYGFSFSYRQSRMLLRSNFVRAVANPELFGLDQSMGIKHSPNIHSFQVLGHFFPPSRDADKLTTNKFFFRFTYHHMRRHWNTNFLQVQVGTSFFIQNRYKN